MNQPFDSTIRRHAGGSIDTDHYLARGRAARSHQTYHLLGIAGRSFGRIWFNLNRHLDMLHPANIVRYRLQPDLG
jgi:hypothetical protein